MGRGLLVRWPVYRLDLRRGHRAPLDGGQQGAGESYRLPVEASGASFTLAFHPQLPLLALGGFGRVVEVWNLGADVPTLPAERLPALESVLIGVLLGLAVPTLPVKRLPALEHIIEQVA